MGVSSKEESFSVTIRGRIAVFVTICMAVVILLTILANVVTARSAMVRDAENLLTEEADRECGCDQWMAEAGRKYGKHHEKCTRSHGQR